MGFYACQHKAETPQPAGNGNTGGTGGGTGGGSGPTGGGTGGTGGGTAGPDTSVCFERDILPIFISNCAKSGCHDAASKQDGYEFTSWATIVSKKFEPYDAEDTELYEKITEKDHEDRMPPPPNALLTSQQIALIKNWIDRGAPNSNGCASTGCDTLNLTFSGTIQPLVNNYCKGCHNNTLPSGGFSYETYAGVAAAVNSGRFLGAVKHQAGFSAMPKGGAKLSDCQIRQIEKWIVAGIPNN
jgi:hypothetical protein